MQAIHPTTMRRLIEIVDSAITAIDATPANTPNAIELAKASGRLAFVLDALKGAK